MSGVPTFIDLTVGQQCLELRSYLKKLGAEIEEENSPEGCQTDISNVIEACPAVLVGGSCEGEVVEGVLNSIISLLMFLSPTDHPEPLVEAFCHKLVTHCPNNKVGHICLKVLLNLYEGLGEHSPAAFDTYYYIMKLAGQVDAVSAVYTDFDKLKLWYQDKNIPVEKIQRLLRLLHEVLLESKMSDQASKVMVELLGTYTEDNASQARDDAHRCIVTCLADPSTFLMDHLLSLKPVRFLEGELIHELLTIFVSERLGAYQTFYSANRDFVASLGLSHDHCLHKMRLLTFMQMAESRREIPFTDLEKELDLPAKDIEGFIIDAVRTKMVQAKMDQMQGKVVVSSTMHRTFGVQQWSQLKEQLTLWYTKLGSVESSMQAVLSSSSLTAPHLKV